jgi:hypothetical protein
MNKQSVGIMLDAFFSGENSFRSGVSGVPINTLRKRDLTKQQAKKQNIVVIPINY